MITKVEFEEIRPYVGAEVPAAIARIVKHPIFFKALGYIFQDLIQDELEMLVSDIHTTYDFQRRIMHTGIRRILKRSSGGLSFSGFEQLTTKKAHVYVSNHRDIFLDSGILQILLVEHGLDTTQITFGSNLMDGALITDLGKINKMFTVFRGGNRREQYENARRLSAYIRQVIEKEQESVWIAQRNGRTKDGNDQTQVGLINMLLASDRKNFVQGLGRLNIIPMAISYEFEPCDFLKVQELYHSLDKPYIKQAGEDLKSIITGVEEYKGRIHLALGKPLDEEALQLIYDRYDKQERYRQIALYIDREIYQNYKIWPNNYIAVDLLENVSALAKYYSKEEYEAFNGHIEKCLGRMKGDMGIMRKMLLEMYAYPYYNQRKFSKS